MNNRQFIKCFIFIFIILTVSFSSNAEAGGRLGYCGGVDQKACAIWQAIPSCDSWPWMYEEYHFPIGTCRALACGGANQRPCKVNEHIPSCKSGLTEEPLLASTCSLIDADGYPSVCGADGENACTLVSQLKLGIKACKPGHSEEYFTNGLIGTCRAIDDDGYPVNCGDANEPACSLLQQVWFPNIYACKTGLVEQFFTNGAIGTCRDFDDDGYPSHCGDDEEPACTIDHQLMYSIQACKPGNFEERYTNGLIGTCHTLEEPTINSTVKVAPQTSGEPVWGWSNVHEHQFANLAYGGAMYWGSPFSDSDLHDYVDVDEALASCDWTEDFETTRSPIPVLDVVSSEDPLGRGFAIHGDPWVSQVIFGLTNNISTGNFPFNDHTAGGMPEFKGWPTYLNGGHQQMYYKWLERAYVGGMRLMVNLAVNNEVLCMLSHKRIQDDGTEWPCHDMNNPYQKGLGLKSTVDLQIDAMYDLQDYVDGMCGGDECGWYRIVTSAKEARDVIEQGKMAVLIGIEVDTLFGCKPDSDWCTRDWITLEIARYKEKGVSYIFPVHGFNNRFAGGDMYKDYFVLANYIATDGEMETWDCSIEGYEYKFWPYDLNDPTDALGVLYGQMVNEMKTEAERQEWYDKLSQQTAHCNARGLTADGQILINELIAQDMIIDIDHLSNRSLNGYGLDKDGSEKGGDDGPYQEGVLDIAKEQARDDGGTYRYPVVSGHAGVYAGNSGYPNPPTSEGSLTEEEAIEIIDLGGIVTLASPHGKCKTSWDFEKPYGIDKDKNKRDLLGYSDLLALMKDKQYPRISLISDFGSFNPQVGPRYKLDSKCKNPGSNECPYQGIVEEDCPESVRDLKTNPDNSYLKYPFEAFGKEGGTFSPQETGSRVFDFNTQGLAHVGMYPDFLADLENVGLTRDKLNPLFGSAEGFLRMWEEIDNCTPDNDPPIITCPANIAVSSTTGESMAVTYDVSAEDKYYCDQDIEQDIVIDIPSGSFFDLGSTTVTASVTDHVGYSDSCSFNVNVSQFVVEYLNIGWECPRTNWLYIGYHGEEDVVVEVRDYESGMGLGSYEVGPNVVNPNHSGLYIELKADEYGLDYLPNMLELTIAGVSTLMDTSCLTNNDDGNRYGDSDGDGVEDLFSINEHIWIDNKANSDDNIVVTGKYHPTMQDIDLTSVDVTLTVSDLYQTSYSITITAGSFILSGNPNDRIFTYNSPTGETNAEFNIGEGAFELEFVGVSGTEDFLGNYAIITLQVGDGSASDIIEQDLECARFRHNIECSLLVDNLPPVPDSDPLPDITGECSVEITDFPTATDGFAGQVVGTTIDPLEYDELGTYTITWIYDDGKGNTATQTQTVIVVEDSTAPDLIAPANVTVSQESADGTQVDLISPSVSDICDTNPVVMSYAPALFSLGTTTVTWTATDASGNSINVIQTVTVVDTTPPLITAPADVTVEQTGANGTQVDLGSPDVSDIGDANPVVTNDAPSVFPFGKTAVTWTATDASGNSSTATQTVTVVDTTPPTISLSAVVTAEYTGADGTQVDLGSPDVSDIGDANPVVTNDAPSVFPLGTTIVTWTATDASGNSSIATQTVVVLDTTPPSVTATFTSVSGYDDRDNKVLYEIEFSADDICDADPTLTAVITLCGRDIPVSSGQIVEIKIHDKNVSSNDKCKTKWKHGRLNIKAQEVLLNVTAVDASGNVAEAQASPTLLPADDSDKKKKKKDKKKKRK